MTNTVHYKLNEKFYSRRSYTHHFDNMVDWEFSIHTTLPNGSLLLQCPLRTDRLIQVERDEVQQINIAH
jgi:hypothetical protein